MDERTLARTITSPQYFALAFGCVVGVAWIVLIGDLIGRAGPLGAAAAVVAGGLVITLVAFCYAEMSGLRPAAGGELVYAHELNGAGAAFGVGWALALLYVATCVFEAISMGLVADMLFPGVRGPLLYQVFGAEVRLGGVLIGIGVTLALWAINTLGTRLTASAQEWITYVRLVLMLGFLAVAIAFAEPANLAPAFGPQHGPAGVAFLGVLTTTPFIFGGFNVFATATEECAGTSTKRRVGRAVVLSILAATLFYVLLVLSIGALVPRAELVQMKLPAAEAFHAVPGGALVAKVVLAAALLGNLTAWNALLIAGSRVLFALGRAGLAGAPFGGLHPTRRTPAFAIGFVSLVSLAGLFLGRGFILPIVNVTSVCFALTYMVTALAVLRLRRTDPGAERPWSVPGGRPTARLALAGSAIVLVIAVAQPWLAAPGKVPAEWWILLGWSSLGALVWITTGPRRALITAEERRRRLSGG